MEVRERVGPPLLATCGMLNTAQGGSCSAATPAQRLCGTTSDLPHLSNQEDASPHPPALHRPPSPAAGGAAQPVPRPALPAGDGHHLPGVIRLQAGGTRAVPGALPLRLHGHRAARCLGGADQEGGLWVAVREAVMVCRVQWSGVRQAAVQLGMVHSVFQPPSCHHTPQRCCSPSSAPPPVNRASSWWRGPRSSGAPCSASRWSLGPPTWPPSRKRVGAGGWARVLPPCSVAM